MNTSIRLPANGMGGLRVRVFAIDDDAIDALAWLFGCAQTSVEMTRYDALSDALQGAEQTPVLIPVVPPTEQLRKALDAGETPVAALSQWCDKVSSFLKTCRQARRRVVLFDTEMMRALPHEIANELGARLGEKLKLRADTPNHAPPPTGSAFAAVAACLLAGDATACALADELEAMTLGPVSSRLPSAATLEAIAAVLRQEGQAQIEGQEQNLLRDSLAQLLETVTGLEKSLATTQDEAQTATRKNRDLLERATAAESKLHTKARELGQVAAERARLSEEKAHLSGLLEAAHYEITALRESTSWKITRPLRALRGDSSQG
ncbi:hypothetical protein [Rhodobacter lacus]|uniref:Uncharacterized protein n=1 Tax=Rhodobacter lacus TaxID=1641972 RepID=A0ABW5ABZ0_9RHOB